MLGLSILKAISGGLVEKSATPSALILIAPLNVIVIRVVVAFSKAAAKMSTKSSVSISSPAAASTGESSSEGSADGSADSVASGDPLASALSLVESFEAAGSSSLPHAASEAPRVRTATAAADVRRQAAGPCRRGWVGGRLMTRHLSGRAPGRSAGSR